MKNHRGANRRKFVALAVLALLAGCKVIPKDPVGPAPPPVVDPTPDVLPTDTTRHRIALLVPMTGPNAAVGQSIANATTMALLDTNAQNLRVTTYDTTVNLADAAAKAVADGNKLILGPLMADQIPAVAAAARAAKVPVISFSNDQNAAARDVFIMGTMPSQSVSRTVEYARSKGVNTFSALVPKGEYGQRASSAMMEAARASGGTVLAMESFDRTSASVTAAAGRVRQKGGSDAVLIADGGRMAILAAPALNAGDSKPRLLGTELWSGESVVAKSAALSGAWFSAVSDGRFAQFSASYKNRFGAQPYRLATLGYDAVLLTLRVAREWQAGRNFPVDKMLDKGGFLGLDGAFRFKKDGVVERALEVREVKGGIVTVVSPAPTKFED